MLKQPCTGSNWNHDAEERSREALRGASAAHDQVSEGEISTQHAVDTDRSENTARDNHSGQRRGQGCDKVPSQVHCVGEGVYQPA